MAKLNLRAIQPRRDEFYAENKAQMDAWAIEGFEKRDVDAMLFGFGNHQRLAFVFDNAKLLLDAGMYEKALLDAFTGCRVNHGNWNDDVIAFLFAMADLTKLQACGDPLPDGDSFEVYRGVSGRGRRRRIRGYSWTNSLDVACWFALRFQELKLAHPAIYTATVSRADVLAYDNGRNEQEFITRPMKPIRMKISLDEMQQRASALSAERKRSDDAAWNAICTELKEQESVCE